MSALGPASRVYDSGMVPMVLAVVIAVSSRPAPAVPSDRSGQYRSAIGELWLIEGPDALVFSYAAAAGERGNEHQCDWTGTARRESATRFVWSASGLDPSLVVNIEPARITMRTAPGGSQCGQGLGDDDFPVQTRKPLRVCTVAVDRTHFYPAEQDSGEKPLAAYATRGSVVEVVPSSNNAPEAFYLARFKGAAETVVGMLRVRDLSCKP
jgi:hypothetical protein